MGLGSFDFPEEFPPEATTTPPEKTKTKTQKINSFIETQNHLSTKTPKNTRGQISVLQEIPTRERNKSMEKNIKEITKFWGIAIAIGILGLFLDTVYLHQGTLPLLDSSLAKLVYLAFIITGIIKIGKKNPSGWSFLAAYCYLQGLTWKGAPAIAYLLISIFLVYTHWEWKKKP